MSKKKSGTKGKATGDIRSIAVNRRARHEYHVDETFEVGIVLQGTEVKSIRAGQLNFKDSFATVTGGELWLLNLHIDEYEQGNRFNHLPTRKRKLLMRKRDITKLLGKTRQDGYTLIPLEFYFKKSWVKVKIGLCKGKKLHDKRHDIAKRDVKREIERAMKHNR